MLQSLLGGDTLLGIVLEDAAEKINELLVEGVTCRDDLLLLGQQDVCQEWGSHLTCRPFIALTYFFEALVVSWLG